jgi:hypothetical protein
MRVSAARGLATPLTTLDQSRKESFHDYPSFLPDGRHFIYLRHSATPENTGVYVGSLDAKPEEQSSKLLLGTAFGPAYVPSFPRRLRNQSRLPVCPDEPFAGDVQAD